MSEAIEALRSRLSEGLSARTGGPVTVGRVEPLVGGACQDNLLIEVEGEGLPARLVVRSDGRGGALAGSVSRRVEAAVIGAAVAEGVPTPAVRFGVDDLLRPGSYAMVLDWAPGIAIGARVLRDPRLEAARAGLPEALATALAAIHRVRPEVVSLPLPVPDDPVEAMLRAQREALDQIGEPSPAIEAALCWLAAARPAPVAPVLVHGDFRVGNFLVAPEGLSAVLDWEFTHWGDPVEDLGWLCVRDWRFGRLDRPVGGLCGRRRFYEAYAAASGRPVDPGAVHYWEVAGNVRWALGAMMQGLRYRVGGEKDLELLAIARRASEMAFEALRLIDAGPTLGGHHAERA